MERKLKGIALLLFALLFNALSGEFQEYLWAWHIGVSVPWGAVALVMGLAGLWLVFSEKSA